MTVAVGLSPRTESKHTIRRRVATAELSTGTGAFNRRSATRDNVVSSPRGLKSTATLMASLCEAPRLKPWAILGRPYRDFGSRALQSFNLRSTSAFSRREGTENTMRDACAGPTVDTYPPVGEERE